MQEKHEAIKPEIKEQRNKIEFYIADLKYPFLGLMLPVMFYQSNAKNGIGVGWLGVVRFVQSQARKIGGVGENRTGP